MVPVKGIVKFRVKERRVQVLGLYRFRGCGSGFRVEVLDARFRWLGGIRYQTKSSHARGLGNRQFFTLNPNS